MDAAALGGVITAVLTQLISLVATRVGGNLPPFAKQLLALAVASGFVNLSTLHPFSHALVFGVDVTGVLNALTVWAASTFVHDVSGTVAPKNAQLHQ